jgi:putative transposase
VTACTKNREPWLATPECHDSLLRAWQDAAGWQVARYVILPNHVHLFAAPLEGAFELDRWMKYWKALFTRSRDQPQQRWQRGHWDTRMRSAAQYADKWEYVRNNPVRHSLAETPDDWPYQGELIDLQW